MIEMDLKKLFLRNKYTKLHTLEQKRSPATGKCPEYVVSFMLAYSYVTYELPLPALKNTMTESHMQINVTCHSI
jgi:hypothetical protein